MYIDLGNPSYPWSPSFEQILAALAEPGCPVCRACNRGLRQYLAWLAREMETQAILDAMATDKKRVDSRLRFVLPRALGEVVIVDRVPQEDLIAVLEQTRT